MKKNVSRLLRVSILLLVVSVLSACGFEQVDATNKPKMLTATQQITDNIVTAYNTEPSHGLIPSNTTDEAGSKVIDALFSRLVTTDIKGNTKYEVAERIDPNEQFTRFKVTLDNGWYFTDGTPVTARSFTRAWSYAANHLHRQANASFFADIQGFEALQTTNDPQAQLSGLIVHDDTHFDIVLRYPVPTMTMKLASRAFAPLPESFYNNPQQFAEHPIGNGPYILQRWEHNHRIVLKTNMKYAGRVAVKNAGLVFKLYNNLQDAYRDVHNGKLDILDQVPLSQFEHFKSNERIQVYSILGVTNHQLMIPVDTPHFRQNAEGILRRQALSMAIDRHALVKNELHDHGVVASDYLAPLISGYSQQLQEGNNKHSLLDYQPYTARKYWNDANAILPWNSEKLAITYRNNMGEKPIAQAIARQIHDTLGIEVLLQAAQSGDLSTSENSALIPTGSLISWTPDYPSAINYLQPLFCSVQCYRADVLNASEEQLKKLSHDSEMLLAYNHAHYVDSKFNTLVLQAETEQSSRNSNMHIQQAERRLLETMPTIPLYVSSAAGVASQKVQGVGVDWQGWPIYRQLTHVW